MARVFLMLCSASTVGECIEKKLFGTKGGKMFAALRSLEIGDYGFLYQYDKDILFGPFRAVSKIGKFDKNIWQKRFPVQFNVEWDEYKGLAEASAVFRELAIPLVPLGEMAKFIVPSQPILDGSRAEALANAFSKRTGIRVPGWEADGIANTGRGGENSIPEQVAPTDWPKITCEEGVSRFCVGEVDRFIDQRIRNAVPFRFSSRSDAPMLKLSPSSEREQATAEFHKSIVHRVIELLKDGSPIVFVTGKAGTGKSTLIKTIRKKLKNLKSIAVVAPTGIAALNAEGQTIHSFCGIQFNDLINIKPLRDQTVIRKIDLLIIDEVSMVRADLLDAMDRSLRLNRNAQEVFGGVQVVFVGDLFQLPPVVKGEDESRFSGAPYCSPHFFSAKALQSEEMVCVELTQVFRQKEETFVRLLEQVRELVSLDSCVLELNRSCAERVEKPNLTLCCINEVADKINDERLSDLSGPSQTYRARIEGEFPSDLLPCPESLKLKVGAQVLFCRNDNDLGRWVNGTRGVVVELGLDTVRVNVTSGEVYSVGRIDWENHSYEVNHMGRVVPKKVGTFNQIPLRLAWAVSIHRSQGLTLDEVQIDLGGGAFADGQVYVALSRCRSLSGISLARPISVNDIRADRRVSWFYQILRGGIEDVGEKVLENLSGLENFVDEIVIRLPEEIREKLTIRAETEGCSIAALIERLVEEQFRPRW
ncbi:MAG TPA: AAA family ATPase [Bacteroidia bacterium]|nr:AAA family ATPase [Bacteroidia bacterium]